MTTSSTTTHALLGLLAIKPWTGYELTQQARRSLRYAWPSSEAHLYREQKRLVRLGWAEVDRESVGKRTRNRYQITPEGRRALARWLDSEPGPPRIEIEGIVRAFFADHGTVDALVRSMRASSEHAAVALDDMLAMVEDYLDTGGPFPERLHVIAIAADLITRLLGQIESFFDETADELETWETTEGLGLTEATRTRLEAIAARHPGADRR